MALQSSTTRNKASRRASSTASTAKISTALAPPSGRGTRKKSIPKLVSRKEAKIRGIKRYFTGKMCPKKHVSGRVVSNGCCVQCLHDDAKRRENLREDKKERQRVRRKRQRLNNPKGFLVNSRRHAAIRKTLTVNWRKNNKERHKANSINYRARKRSADGQFNEQNIFDLFKKQKGRCVCNTKLTCYHIDHKNPLSRGGSNWPRNLQLLCERCNTSKGAKTMKEWLRRVA